MISTLLVVTLLAVLACAAVIALYVVPFVRTVDMAERRSFSPNRFGAIALVFALMSAGLAYAGLHTHALLVPAALLAWAGPALVAVLPAGHRRLGRQGAHES